jgi:hydrogenase nickel incorporation protein HypB
MGRFHRHVDGFGHEHDHEHDASSGHAPSSGDATSSEPGRSIDGEQGHRHDGTGDMSGYQAGPQRVLVLEHIFAENDRCAESNRQRLDAAGVVAVNMMSSPGAGKTEILRHTLGAMSHPERLGIIEGDIETSIDADRLAGFGAQVALLNTSSGFGGECHLDAPMVASALQRLDLAALDLLFIENVGNLVCPAEFDVGAHHRVMVYAITEGEEKPLKYPVMFRAVELVLVNKLDLLPHLDFDLALFRRNLAAVNPTATVLEVSARTSEGLAPWYDWLAERRSVPEASSVLS